MSDNMDVIRRQAMKKKKNMKIFLIFSLAVFFIFFIIFMYMNFFNIRDVKISGLEGMPYTEEEIILSSGVKKGDNLLSLSSKEVKKKLCDAYPYIKEVDIAKKYPSRLELSLEFYDAAMAIELGEDVFLISSDGKVLGTANDGQSESSALCFIATPFVLNCIEGRLLEFKNEDSFKVLTDIYSSFEKSGIARRLTRLDVQDKYNVKAQIDSRFNVTFGTFENSDEKAELLASVMKEDMWTDVSGEIDVSDSSTAVVRLTGASAT